MTLLTLASTSSGRKKLLEDAGIDFVTLAPGVDEEALVASEQPAGVCAMTLLLATHKARAGVARANTRLVLGCDSALEFDGQNLGKPLIAEVAIERWGQMRGKSGFLHSGHHLIDTQTGKSRSVCSKTKVFFAELTDKEIEAYVESGEPLNVAGSFTIDGRGGPFIERIEGDYHTVVGLSLVELRRMLAELGHDITSLWR
ncbi:MAG: Maf family protein [Aquiluna sp.]